MGAWGFKIFENDDASDWVCDLEVSSDLATIESAAKKADDEYIEAPDGCHILAAGEILLALQGKERTGLPEEAKQWVSRNSALDSTALTQKSIQAIDKVLSDTSELKELWQDSDEYEVWVKDVTQIRSILFNN